MLSVVSESLRSFDSHRLQSVGTYHLSVVLCVPSFSFHMQLFRVSFLQRLGSSDKFKRRQLHCMI